MCGFLKFYFRDFEIKEKSSKKFGGYRGNS